MLSFIRNNPLLVAALAGLVIFLGIHVVWYIRPSNIKTAADLNAHLTDGRPTVVEYYSNL